MRLAEGVTGIMVVISVGDAVLPRANMLPGTFVVDDVDLETRWTILAAMPVVDGVPNGIAEIMTASPTRSQISCHRPKAIVGFAAFLILIFFECLLSPLKQIKCSNSKLALL